MPARTIVDTTGELKDLATKESATITPDGNDMPTLDLEPEGFAFIPPEGAFLGDDDYLAAVKLYPVVDMLRELPEFRHLQQVRIDVLWKKKGGKSKGKARFGQANKPSGMLAHYCTDEFVIWLAADHCREAIFTNRQIEALLYHELKHCGFEYDEETGEQKWVIWPHDIETFASEVARYGAWTPDLRKFGDVWAQIALEAGPTP